MKMCRKRLNNWFILVVLSIAVFLCVSFVFVAEDLSSPFFTATSYRYPKWGSPLNTIHTEGCRIPAMEIFAESIKKYISEEPPLVCNRGKPPLVEADDTSLHILNFSLIAYGIRNLEHLLCCYRGLYHHNDTTMWRAPCVRFQSGVAVQEEYVQVTCMYKSKLVYQDFFSFIKIDRNLRIRRSSKPSVLIVGMDGMSRLNLHRQMPLTAKVLQDIGALEFLGYHKVADNTFPNLIPVLSGMTKEQLYMNCWYEKGFDTCPFIWKAFSDNGFLTAFGEDASSLGLFTHGRAGFAEKPTDYYWNPFNYIMEREIGNTRSDTVFRCVGARPTYKVLLNYIERFALTMHRERLPYFAFFWGSTLSHDSLNQPRFGDNDYALLFRRLKMFGALRNTVLIFMSDHGMRWGDFRSTFQGRLEASLPFLFISLPESLKKTYGYAFNNLVENTKRLTTPFDLHWTLKDLVDHRKSTTWRFFTFKEASKSAYSLFEEVPLGRTCFDAEVSEHWCACATGRPEILKARATFLIAKLVVSEINKKLTAHAALCDKLHLSEVKGASRITYWRRLHNVRDFLNIYTITLQTSPGQAIFEATVTQYFENNTYRFRVFDAISRVSLYKNQGDCLAKISLQLYCHCKVI